MGKLKDRQGMTIYATLVGWRKLTVTSNYFSGIAVVDGTRDYVPCIQFAKMEHFPALRGYWSEHFIATDFRERLWMIPIKKSADRTQGPLI